MSASPAPVALPLNAYVAADTAGNLYFNDVNNYSIVKQSPDGVVSVWAGSPGTRGVADGAVGTGQLTNPHALAFDAAGNLAVADHYYTLGIDQAVPRAAIRKITPAGTMTTFAGSATAGNAQDWGTLDGVGTAARFRLPTGLAFDPAGNLFVSDAEAKVIRKVTPSGQVTTVAGTVGIDGTADGIAATARFSNLGMMVSDAAGNLYVTDVAIVNAKAILNIRKITPAAVVTTLTSIPSFTSSLPGLAIQPNSGTLYLADNKQIFKITPTGVMSSTGITYDASDTAGLTFMAPNTLIVYAQRNVKKITLSE